MSASMTMKSWCQRLMVGGAVASILGLGFAIGSCFERRSEITYVVPSVPVTSRNPEDSHITHPVAKVAGPYEADYPKVIPPIRGSVARLRSGTMDPGSVTAEIRDGLLKIRVKNKMWLSSQDVFLDGTRRGRTSPLKTMHLAVEPTVGRHKLEIRATRGSIDEGHSAHQFIDVS